MEHSYKSTDIEFPQQRIEMRDMEKEVRQSFIEYSMSVITSRALPDVRDGMKPGQRRILYAMYEDNLTHDKPFRKSATTVGNVLGRYHPHGDASVYDALVRIMYYHIVDNMALVLLFVCIFVYQSFTHSLEIWLSINLNCNLRLFIAS